MADLPKQRRLIVFVRDRMGRPIQGSDISFSIDGTAYGQVDGSEGRGEITLPSTNKKPIDVTVSYKGETKTSKVASGVENYTFSYDIDIAPPDTGHLALWVGCVFVAVAVALAFLVKNITPIELKIINGLFSLGCGGFAAELTGFIKADASLGDKLKVSAGGALAVFVILWFSDGQIASH